MMKRFLLAALVLSAVAVPGTAPAVDCSGPTAPPPEYGGGTHSDPVFGYRVATGLPAKAWVAVYYQDGYWVLDASDPNKPTYREFYNYNQGGEKRGFDIKIVGGTAPSVCVHGRLFSQWPMAESGDGCIIVGNANNLCDFKGGGTVGTAGFPPVEPQDTGKDAGGYVAAAEDWAIYRLTKNSQNIWVPTILYGSSIGSPAGGLVTYSAGVRYYACVGTVGNSSSIAGTCRSAPGALVATHV